MSLLSAGDLVALEEIADLDDEEENPSKHEDVTGGAATKHDSDFGSDDDSLFEFIDDDTEWIPVDPALSNALEKDRETGIEQVRDGGPACEMGAQASSQGCNNSLKRPASADGPPDHSLSGRPAKLEKSFSEGLDELLAHVSLDTVPDDSGLNQHEEREACQVGGTNLDSIDALLEEEEEIKATLAASTSTKPPFASLPEFHIPSDVLTRAIASNTSSDTTYWSHTMYRGQYGQPVTLMYARTRDQSEKIAQSMLNEPVLGFDLEWATSGPLKGIKREVSLVQLACEDKTALFHIALHHGDTADELFAPSLRKILESPEIIKTGVCVWKADGSRLLRVCNIRCQGLMELSHLHHVAYEQRVEDIGEQFISLARQTKHVLRLPLRKEHNVRASRWELELNQQQVLYAANDAYVGYMLFRHLEYRRLQQWPGRKRPAFAELRIKMRQQYRPEGDPEPDGKPTAARSAQNSRSVGHHRTSGRSKSGKSEGDPLEDDRVKVLFDALCDHRQTLSLPNRHSAPGKLPSDTTLENIAVTRPHTEDDLAAIRGIGPVWMNAYGDAWLRIVRRYSHLWTEKPPPACTFRMPPQLPPESALREQRKVPARAADSDDDDAFEVMTAGRNNHVNTARWVV